MACVECNVKTPRVIASKRRTPATRRETLQHSHVVLDEHRTIQNDQMEIALEFSTTRIGTKEREISFKILKVGVYQQTREPKPPVADRDLPTKPMRLGPAAMFAVLA